MNPAAPSIAPPAPIDATSQDIPATEFHSLGGIAVGCAAKRRALIFSLWDGVFANAMLALLETFGVAAAVYLKAPAIAISMLASVPLLLSSFGQLLLPHAVKSSKGRKTYVIRGTTAQSVALILLATSGWFPHQFSPWIYVAFFAIYGFSGNVISGLWIAWMGDLVTPQIRGRHFAWRNRIFSLTQLLCTLVAGLILRRYTTDNAPWMLFASLFFIAGIFRLTSTQMLACQYEPPPLLLEDTQPDLSAAKPQKPFLFYAFSAALMQGSVALCGPFFNVWYIRDLHFDYFTLSAAAAATVLGTIISLPLWGKLSDTIGSRRVILITGFLISTVPLPYLISNYSWQIWLLNFYTGVCWSGYNLSNFNFLLIAAGKHKPEFKISIAVAITGICVFLFSLAGGFLATRLPVIFSWKLQSLFFLSAILRFATFGSLFFRYPHYERHLDSRSIDIFHQIPGYRSGIGILRNSFRAFRVK